MEDIIAKMLSVDPVDILTTGPVAEIIGSTTRAVTAAAQRGTLRGYQIGSGHRSIWYFVRSDVYDYIKNKRTWKGNK